MPIYESYHLRAYAATPPTVKKAVVDNARAAATQALQRAPLLDIISYSGPSGRQPHAFSTSNRISQIIDTPRMTLHKMPPDAHIS